MFGQFDDLDEFLNATPEHLADLERLYQCHSNYGEQTQGNSPFYAFLYLINYDDHFTPYDYVPSQHLGYLELDLLGAGLVSYALNAELATKWLDQLFYLIEKQEIYLGS
jgi:hypothetical protein